MDRPTRCSARPLMSRGRTTATAEGPSGHRPGGGEWPAMHPDRRPRPATGNLKAGSTGTLMRTSWPQDFTSPRYRGYAASFWMNEAASWRWRKIRICVNKREHAPSFEHGQLDHRPQPSSTQAVRATTRSDVSSAVLQCRSIQTSPDARPRARTRCSRHAGSELSTSVLCERQGLLEHVRS